MHTCRIDKAKERLGYGLLVGTDEGIRRGVERALKERIAYVNTSKTGRKKK